MVSRDLGDPQFAAPGSPHLSFSIKAPTLGSSQPRKGNTVDPRLLCCSGGLASLPRLCPLGALEQGYRFRSSFLWRRGSTPLPAPCLEARPRLSEEPFHCPICMLGVWVTRLSPRSHGVETWDDKVLLIAEF